MGFWRSRFNFFFLDTVLILIWLMLLGIVVVGGIFTMLPSLPLLIQKFATAEKTAVWTAIVFASVSSMRFLHSYGYPVWSFPLCYLVTYLATSAAILQGWMKVPTTHLVVSNFTSACIVTFMLIPFSKMRYVWDRIKPLPRAPRYRRAGAGAI